MRGMTLDLAMSRVFELEQKEEVHVNRQMMAKYLDSLQLGMQRNEEAYFLSRGIDPELGR